MRATSSFVTRSGVMARVFRDVVGVALGSASRRAAGRLASNSDDPVRAGELSHTFCKCGSGWRVRRAPVRNGVPYVLAAIIASCGGRTWDEAPSPPGGAGVGTGTGSPAAAPPGLGPDCPQGVPTPTSPCGRDGLECEYGNDREVQCNTVAECSSQSGWTLLEPETSPSCPSPPSGLAPSCPATYASVPVGATCPLSGARCDFPEGFCGCSYIGNLTQHAPPPPLTWTCELLDPSCPRLRPRVGSLCNRSGQSCGYGGAVSVYCDNGYWSMCGSPCDGRH
jgi:hypothetical protein